MNARATAGRRRSDRQQRAADFVVDAVAQTGCKYVFGIPGAAISPVFDALCDHTELTLVVPKHEMNAVFGAIGYARASGQLGVVAVTSGPGILNAITGIASAQLDGVPLLVLVGEARRAVSGHGALQEGGIHGLNIVNMLRPLAKLALEVPDATAVPFTIRQAIDTAMSGRRGVVVVTLPLDVSMTTIQVPYISSQRPTHFEFETPALDAAAKALTRSPQAVLFVGNGCRWGEAPALLRELAERLQLPVMTTPKGKGVFPERHPLSLGVFGSGGHPSTMAYLSKGVDVLLALGTRLGELSSQGWSALLKPARTMIHVDIEGTQVGRSYPTHVHISAPAEQFLERLLEHPSLKRAPPRTTTPTMPVELKTYGLQFHKDAQTSVSTTAGRVMPERAVVELARRVGPRARFAVDNGEHTLYAIHYTPANEPDAFFAQLGLGAMGASIAAGIGMQAADLERPTVVICGDGGFLMCAGEVATAAQAGLPVIFAVFNDHRLGMTELGHHAFYKRSPAFPTGPANLAELARSLGAEGHTITSPTQFASLDLGRRRNRPVVLDIQTDPTAVFSKGLDSKRGWMAKDQEEQKPARASAPRHGKKVELVQV